MWLKALRQLPQIFEVPVVFFTAPTQRDELAEYGAMGDLNIIGKPFDPLRRRIVIDEIWARHHG